ncbi:HisA/HisF-related TIM barrel protein [Lysobacter panacisoli]|uniref:1-(5-phosphoribosyl)-5-[(5-phosphoribosylamino)methylideneamino] imidazole-4-carboxamide isomerase n=1 Tax=Lysobacter panacisoli TaxID=1255263 RepID=A0ABP9LR46_9GAMM|nr:1-(5-phosphoribosyl)-5-[(5-phosphoribosylamino)methylideneamino] imidazole-4-carboxamide isomerase [Lysobacter panacisoli]
MNASPSFRRAAGFQLYPAIDVRDGRVVRLHQGDYERETRYEPTPIDLARRYVAQGAQWLHLVDLDAARLGGYSLHTLVCEIADAGLRVQTGGGVRSDDDIARILDAGAERVVIGSLAVREPVRVGGWIERFGADRLTFALDARQDARGEWCLPVAGWTRDSGARLDDMLDTFAEAGVTNLLCTDIARDGTLGGPNLELYRLLASLAPGLEIQASGGIRDIDDIVASQAVGCAGAVLGKALIENAFDLSDAIDRVRAC